MPASFFVIINFFIYYLALILGIFSLFNLNLIMLFTLQYLHTKKQSKKNDVYPTISIIVPTYNEEENIKNCLKSLLSCDYYLKNMEIICVDDGSTDKTMEIVKKISQQNPIVKLIRNKHGGKSQALNTGLKYAKNNYIFTIDADIVLERTFLKSLTSVFDEQKVAYSFGLVLIRPAKSSKLIHYFQMLEYYFMNLMRLTTSCVFKYPVWFSGQAVCFSRSALKRVGGFSNDTLTEDFDMSLTLYKLGNKANFVKTAVAYTQPTDTFYKLAKQRMRWYFGGIQNLIKHRKQLQNGSLLILYVFFSYSLWFFNSLLFFPTFIYLVSTTLIFNPLNGILFLLRSGTFLGTFELLRRMDTLTFSNYNLLIYFLIGILLLVLFTTSIFSFNKKPGWQIWTALATYFFYVTFLQGCFVLSLFHYGGSSVKGFTQK